MFDIIQTFSLFLGFGLGVVGFVKVTKWQNKRYANIPQYGTAGSGFGEAFLPTMAFALITGVTLGAGTLLATSLT